MQLFDRNINKWTLALFEPILKKIPDSVSPNKITYAGLIFALLGFSVFTFLWQNIWLLLVVAWIALFFDLADGMLARYRKLASFSGKIHDSLADNLVNIAFLSCLYFFYTFTLGFLYLFVFIYIFKFLLVVFKRDREIGGGRASFLIGFVIFLTGWVQGANFELLLYIFATWNLLGLSWSLHFSKKKDFDKKPNNS